MLWVDGGLTGKGVTGYTRTPVMAKWWLNGGTEKLWHTMSGGAWQLRPTLWLGSWLGELETLVRLGHTYRAAVGEAARALGPPGDGGSGGNRGGKVSLPAPVIPPPP